MMAATRRIGVALLCCVFFWLNLVKTDDLIKSIIIEVATESRPAAHSSPNGDASSSDEAYLKWLQEARERSFNLSSAEEPIKVNYRAMNGLGHQLGRLSSAYHLAMLYQLPRIWPSQNPYCRDIYAVYHHLIGEGPIMVDIPFFGGRNLFRNESLFPRPNVTLETLEIKGSAKKRELNIVNEVPGYFHGRGLWNIDKYLVQYNFFGKEDTDYQLYHQLMMLFGYKHKARIQKFLDGTRFNKHTVFGLHVRTGNGESGDFMFKHRGMNDLDGWIERVVSLLCDYSGNHSHYFTDKPLMVYVGTDTGSVIPKMQAASNATCGIPIVSSDQTHPEEGDSVTWSQGSTGDDDNVKCVKGWEDMVLDMYLFTRCNTVMAGTYSSFTQSAPLSFMMHKAKQQLQQEEVKDHHPHYFCDVGVDGNRIDCSSTLVEWLRQTPNMTWGEMNATKQRMRHEITFPIMEQSGGIWQAFEKVGVKANWE